MALLAIDIREAFKLSGETTVSETFGTPASLINLILPNVFVVAGLIFFALLLFSGFGIITAGGDRKAFEKASLMLRSAILGFVIIIASYWIIQIIQIATGLNILESGK